MHCCGNKQISRALKQVLAVLKGNGSKGVTSLSFHTNYVIGRHAELSQRENDGLPSMHLSPEEMERRAWVQAGFALERGKAGDAKAMTSIAEQMRKRAAEDRDAERASVEAEENFAAQNENTAMDFFGMAAQMAAAMVHHPNSAPAAFLQMIKRWREINLGEGEKDAEARAAIVAKASQRYLDGSWVETTPEDVRAYLKRRWDETRKGLARE